MSKTSRNVLISELDALANGRLSEKVNLLDERWLNSFNTYGGENITEFPDAVKAGEIVLSDYSSNNAESVLPRLKAVWDKDVTKKTSSYQIVIDGKVVKIGALKDGVKGTSFSQYLSGISGSPSRRSCGVYTFLSTMLRNGHKVEIYHVTMDGVTNVDVPTIDGVVNREIAYSSYSIEGASLEAYRRKSGDKAPLLNFKERNATFPREFDMIYEIINQRILKTKRYVA